MPSVSPASTSTESGRNTRTGGKYLHVLVGGAFLIVVPPVVAYVLAKSPPATEANRGNLCAKHIDQLIAQEEMIPLRVGTTTTRGKQLTPAALYARSRGAVATVVTKDDLGFQAGLGSGFFVGGTWVESSYSDFSVMEKVTESYEVCTGYLLTNYHVIESAATAEVRLDDGRSGWVHDVVMEDEDLDLALLSCCIMSAKAPAFLSMAEGPDRPIGEKVYAIGSPQGLEASLSEGIISGRRETPTGISRLQTTAAVSPGSSGSPLLNSSGQVVGVVQATSVGGQNLNFVIPASEIITFLVGPCNTRELWRERSIREEEDDAYGKALASTRLPVSKSDIGVVLCRAHCHMREREYEEATRVLANALPAHAGEHKYLLYYTIGSIAQRKVPVDEIRRSAGTVMEAYARLTRNTQYQSAIKWFEKSIRLNADFSPACKRLTDTLADGGEFAEALRYADLLVRRVPRCATAYKLRGRLHSELDHDLAAYRDFATALELGPGDPETHLYWGDACVSIKEYANAIEAYENALRLRDRLGLQDRDFPPKGYLCYRLAHALRDSGRYEKALAYFEKAKQLDFFPELCDLDMAECRRRLTGQYP